MHSTPGNPETPDIETSSEGYARRFSGMAGEYFLEVQRQAVLDVLNRKSVGKVADMGGGHGQLIPLFLELGSQLTVFASDPRAHQRVRQAFPDAGIQFDTGDFHALPYPDNSFDLVIAVRLIPHIDAWEALLKEFCRVSRGSVIIDYPSWCSLNILTPIFFKLKKSLEGNTRTYTSFFRQDLAREFRNHGFRVHRARSQFFFPMFIHRALEGAGWLRVAEKIFRVSGLTSLFGSPVILRADKIRERP